jgi:hypothetical protein
LKIDLKKITQYQDEQCKLFSNFSVFSSLSEYKKRNQFDKDKIVNDIYNGKKAEFMVYNFLVSKNKQTTSPDLNIYEKHNKSYSPDLLLKNANIHVKSHVVNSNYPVSWVFQKKDPLIFDLKNNNFLALVVINEENNYMYLKKITEVKFEPPFKKSLEQTKVCVYEKDFLYL